MIDQERIQYLEKLSRIQLSDDQRTAFRQEIGRILEYMEILSAFDLDSEDGFDALSVAQTGRPDERRDSLSREALLASSPDATAEYMTVPLAVQ